MSHSLHIIEHPEPDFDLEAELPADLAALADQLTADADFLTGRYPSGTTKAGETAGNAEQPEPVEAPTSRRKRGARWWLRAAAVLLMLSGLGTVLTGGDRQSASCQVSSEVIEAAASSGASHSVVVTQSVASESVGTGPKLTEVATVDPPSAIVTQPFISVAGTSHEAEPAGPKATPVGVFLNLSGAEQEALLDFNEGTSSLGASVSF